ncbi:nickel-dependent lactate racemase [Treponema primitia]|uniref:nickel-dependent lactate racemase n=1 Tax=Treponema primitia TaxID=88058 RepID=UPI00397FCC64
MNINTTLIEVPYGTQKLSCTVPADRIVRVLRPAPPAENGGSELDIIKQALAAPIASPPLAELARGKKNIVILTSDHTRPVPSHLTLPAMLGEIRRFSPEARITILIGTGCHRATSREEMEKKFGAELCKRETIINHNSEDPASLVSLGRLPSGGELVINRLAAEADLLVADGFIEPHQFAGFSGGRKSVLPGIASFTTVLASHNAEFTVHPKSRPGSLEGNLIHQDMLYAARQAKLAFILNVALSPAKRVIAAFAGDTEKAHLSGCDFVLKHCGVKSPATPVVITANGGYPLDQNVYQSTKSIMQADLVCEDGGVIIAANECRDGHGSESFYRIFKESPSLDTLLGEIEKRGREETVPDQWVIQLTALILRKRTVIFVSSVTPDIIKDLHMRHAANLDEALAMADKIIGRENTPITVLPDAVSLVLQ